MVEITEKIELTWYRPCSKAVFADKLLFQIQLNLILKFFGYHIWWNWHDLVHQMNWIAKNVILKLRNILTCYIHNSFFINLNGALDLDGNNHRVSGKLGRKCSIRKVVKRQAVTWPAWRPPIGGNSRLIRKYSGNNSLYSLFDRRGLCPDNEQFKTVT